tara:strand:+ start:1239 stop:2828 length:1590 start_codon:yes stop_codon:yes gene_type:complete
VKIIYYFILCLYAFGCAVQGPISGGPVDESPPVLLSTTPENFSTSISKKQQIVLDFNELIDPLSVYNSVTINNQDFKIKVKGKRVVLYPTDEWDSNFLIDIYINRNLGDYQKNTLKNPLNLFYSLGKDIPMNTINGNIVDFENVINKYNRIDSNILFEVGLFRNLDSGKKLIKKVHSNKNLNFIFNAIQNGSYSIAVVEDKIIDINVDFYKRRYGILDNINISSENEDSLNVRINISNPISKKEISSINFINQYYVNYIFSDNTVELGIIDSIYNNFNERDFSGELMKVSLIVKNNFESYSTDIFEFIIPEVIDTISPFINLVSIDDLEFSLEFSEPLEKFENSQSFYILDDSSRIYIDFKFEDSELKNIVSMDMNQIIKYDIGSIFNLNIEKNIIKDLYGNSLLDSMVTINMNEQINVNKNIGVSKVSGKILNGNISNPLAVSLYNTQTLENFLILADKNHHFSFKSIQPGTYFLQCYENYNLDAENPYPYFSGKWNSGQANFRFSDILGPIETRANWDIEDIIIELK